MNSRLQTEVCVLGAGPAGSAISQRLAQLGHSVVVVEKSAFPRSHVGESLAGNILPLLDVLGLRARVEQVGFSRPETAMVRWAGDQAYERPAYGEPGFQVDRGRFDKLLLDAAVECGARLLQPARITNICHRGDLWLVDVSLSGKRVGVEANFLVDATGRVNILGGKKLRTSAPMLALWAYWKNVVISSTATRVESGAHEWFWGAPLADGTFNAAVFLDPRRYREGVEQTGNLTGFYESLLAGSNLLRSCVSGRRASRVSACDAGCYMAEEIVTPSAIKVGEAAFTIDPLSSQGVQTAIGTALQAAAVLHTISRRPENTGLAIDFYNSRQREAVNRHAASAASFFAQAADFYGTGFWRRGAAASNEDIAWHVRRLFPTALPCSDAWIQISHDCRIVTVPCLVDDYIVEARAVAHPALDGPLVFAEDRPVANLLKEADSPLRVRDLLQRWAGIMECDAAQRVLLQLCITGILHSGSAD